MSSEIIVALIALLSSGVATTIVSWFLNRTKHTAEADAVAVATAERVIKIVNLQLADMETRIAENEEHIAAQSRYIKYIHDRLVAYAINLPTFEEWKETIDDAKAT